MNKFKSLEELLKSSYDVALMESAGLDEYLIWMIENNFTVTTGCDGRHSARYGSDMEVLGAYVSIITNGDDVKLCIHELFKATSKGVIETSSIIMSINAHDYYFSKGLKAPTEKEIELARLLEEWANRWMGIRKPKKVVGAPAPTPVPSRFSAAPTPAPTPTPIPTATTHSTTPGLKVDMNDITEIAKAISNIVISDIVRDLTSFRREIKE